MAERIGTPLQGPVRIKSTLTPKPIAYSNEIAGGPWNVQTVAQMHAIQSYYRRDDANNPLWGATCYVHSDPVSSNNGRYELVRGLVDNNIDNNDNWQKVSSSTGGSSLTAAQIKSLYESNPDTEVFTTAEKTKLAGISGMTPAQIKASYESNANTEAFTTAEKNKLALQSGSNTGDETDQSILGKLLNNPDVNIVTDAEKGVIGSISGVNTGDETPEAVLTKLLTNDNTEQFTTEHRSKLEGLEDSKFRGKFTSLTELQTAYPVGQPGWNAYVDAGVGNPIVEYIWDDTDDAWELQEGTATAETPESVKTKYESNVNTNAYDDASKAKVDNLSGVNTGDETPSAIKTKLLQNADTNNFGDAEVLKLNGALQDIDEGTNVTIDKTNPNVPVISAELDLSYYETPGNIYLLPMAFYVSSINGGGNFSLNDTQILFSVYNQGGIEIISGTNPFLLVDNRSGSNQKGWALEGFNADNSGPLSIMPKSWIEARIAEVEGGGTGPTKATQVQAETATDDAAYMSPLNVLQSMEARAGIGIEWNAANKRYDINVVNNLTSDSVDGALSPAQGKVLKGLIDKQFYLGFQRETQGDYVSDYEYNVELAYNGFKQDVWKIQPQQGISALYNITIDSAGSDLNQPWSGYVLIGGDFGLSDINTFRLPIGWDVSSGYKDVVIPANVQALYKFTRMAAAIYWEFIGDNSEIGGKYPDETVIGTAITASRTFALTDLGAKKVTAVNSGSAVVLTIPADATLNMPIGSTINLRRRGAGTVQIVGATGVNIEGIGNTNGDHFIIRFGSVTLYKESANLWVLIGALETT